jgi:aspartate carbamoyltransferase catalytic subunit
LRLEGRDLVSILDLSKGEVEELFKEARAMEERPGDFQGLLEGCIIALLFFEPSTRTRLSFEAAAKRLGGSVIGFTGVEATSMAKGESFEDTVRVVDAYCDVMVLRHPLEGAARRAAELVEAPVINAGDGANEHPTQALVDLYTIWRLRGGVDGVKVAFLADLRRARAVNSLLLALTLFEGEALLIDLPGLNLQEERLKELRGRGLKVRGGLGLKEALREADVLYVTRIQRERFTSEEEYLKVRNAYRLRLEDLKEASSSLLILHPLPRAGEVDESVDKSVHAAYFKQAAFGVPVRMALLASVAGRA